MSDRERAKTWIDEMSSNNLDRILYFMNLVLTKEELITERCNLKKEKQQLISFLEEKMKKCKEKYGNYVYDDYSVEKATYDTYQEVLDFVNKGGKE